VQRADGTISKDARKNQSVIIAIQEGTRQQLHPLRKAIVRSVIEDCIWILLVPTKRPTAWIAQQASRRKWMVRPTAFHAHLENTSTLKVKKYVEIVKLVIIAQVDMEMVQTPILPVVCFVSLENIKILRVKQVVFPAHQVGTKTSPNK
jgi:hypothetical protein